MRPLSRKMPLWFAAASVFGITAVHAEVKLPSVISDHAVLQKSAKTALWGKAAPNEKITAKFAGLNAETTTDSSGRWQLALDLTHVGVGPFDLTVEGRNTLVVHDVVVGEVWLASGQSNMEFPLTRAIGGKEEIAASTDPQLRQFRVADVAAATPQDNCEGKWVLAGPTTSGDFTAVGYFFAKELRRTLKVPVGLLSTYWGGTPVETWTSAEALDSDPALKEARSRIDKTIADYTIHKAEYVTAFHDWAKKYDRADKPADPAAFAAPGISTSDWKTVTLPGKFAAAGLPDAGVVWLRKTVPLHGAAVGGSYRLTLNGLDGFETVYYNGKRVGAVTPETINGLGADRAYYPAGSIDGDNVIAIRLYNPVGGAGFSGDAEHFRFGPAALGGEWLAKAETGFPALADDAGQALPQPPKSVMGPSNRPSTLFNGMIQPLIHYTLQGAIWYQGESNTGRALQYRTAFPLMITDWRRRWGSEFPFYWCQLANYMAKKPEPGESGWAELREAQTRTLSLPKTGQAIVIDLGEAGDIHPRDKQHVGMRLAALALARTYGQKVACSGPVYESQQIEGDKIRVRFRDADGGLVAKPLPAEYTVSSLAGKTLPLTRNRPASELEGFAVCGEDRKWVWADARIDGGTVVVWNASVPHPVAVRYAWADMPTVNLYNGAGYPAVPFRTDSFPGATDQAHF